MARKVLNEIQVGFLMVGHTHKDIDVYFSYLLKRLKISITFILVDLLKESMTPQQCPFVPQFIQEVADFKSFIKGYHHKGASVVMEIIDMHLFCFFVDDLDCPSCYIQNSSTNYDWLSESNPSQM